ncbi:DUF5613 domain-containing protein [Sporosarcina cascadiensis]|uniref:DUF5613 domain-containing protein n=1 Tax=Sporosarcina cascadiensis TaxID=2660747 RepID=UPI001E35D328|nr:DUF5613 domain-containing protein [Sporosarcina cascadiensis]
MKKITFANIYTLGNIVTETNQYRHVHYPKMLSRYDSNFIAFKDLPSIEDFEDKEEFLRTFHVSKGQNHVKFCFPESVELPYELNTYLQGKGYDIGFLELYAIQPSHFPSVTMNSGIDIQAVTEDNLEIFLDLQYLSDVQYGEEFAKQKTDLLKRQFSEPNIHQVLAFYKGKPAGSVD